jgi:magnesium transporter
VIRVHESHGKPVWVDLHEPSAGELAEACDRYGLDIPPRERLEEIEFSSRLQYEDGIFTISVPVTPHHGRQDGPTVPLGFVLTRDLLVTVRFSHFHVFETVVERVNRRPRTAPDIFLVILEAMIDYGADRLEELRDKALRLSNHIFQKPSPGRRDTRRTGRVLNNVLLEIGDMGARLSHIRDTLLVLQRAVPFLTEHGDDWLEAPVKARLKMAGADVASLNDYEVHLTDKIQFLLDAALGFINAEQNELFKVMTVWSVAGIPPVLFAGIWGMNFHFMPELALAWGYPLALTTIALSIVIPLLWFKKKGWW